MNEVITDFTIGLDRLDGPRSVSANALMELGSVASLDQQGLSALLTSSVFAANGAVQSTVSNPPLMKPLVSTNSFGSPDGVNVR